MPTCRVYERPDGGVSVVTLAEKNRRPAESDDAFFARVIPKTGLEGLPYVDVDPATLPSRRFRDAWTLTAGKVSHDLPKARALRLAELRAGRDILLAESDGPKLRALERGAAKEIAALDAYRQALRDLPAQAEAELAAIVRVEDLATYEPTWPTP